MYSTVYELLFPDGSRYVGMTNDLSRRLIQHKNNPSESIEEKIKEFGKEQITCNVIEKDLHNSIAYGIERIEISKTPSVKRLNKQGDIDKASVLQMHKNACVLFEEDYITRVGRLRKNLNSVIIDLHKLYPLYGKDRFDNKHQLQRELKSLMDHLSNILKEEQE